MSSSHPSALRWLRRETLGSLMPILILPYAARVRWRLLPGVW
jgi:hypothetical protein